MPQVIEIPGQGEVEFPDSMSDAQVLSAVRRLSEGPGMQYTHVPTGSGAEAASLSAHNPQNQPPGNPWVEGAKEAVAHPIDSLARAAPALGGMARLAGNGMSLGLLPAASAALAAAAPSLEPGATAGAGPGYGDRFRKARAYYEQRLAQTRDTAGLPGAALEMAGGAATGLGAARYLPAPASAASAVATGPGLRALATRLAGPAIDALGYAGGTAALYHADSPTEAVAAAGRAMTPGAALIGAAGPALAEATGPASQVLEKSLARFANRRAFLSTSPGRAAAAAAREHFGSADEAGASLLAQRMPDGSPALAAGDTAANINSKLEAIAQQTGESKGALVKLADDLGVTGDPTSLVANLRSIYSKHFDNPTGRALNSDQAAGVKKLIDSIEAEFKPDLYAARTVQGAGAGAGPNGAPTAPGQPGLSPDGTIREPGLRRSRLQGDTQNPVIPSSDGRTFSYGVRDPSLRGLTPDELAAKSAQIDSQLIDARQRLAEMTVSHGQTLKGRTLELDPSITGLQSTIDDLHSLRADVQHALPQAMRYSPATTRPQPDSGWHVVQDEQPFSAYEQFKTGLQRKVRDTAAAYPRSDEAIQNNPGLRALNEMGGAIRSHNDTTFNAKMGDTYSADAGRTYGQEFARLKQQYGDVEALRQMAQGGVDAEAVTRPFDAQDAAGHYGLLRSAIHTLSPKDSTLARYSSDLSGWLGRQPQLSIPPETLAAIAALRSSKE